MRFDIGKLFGKKAATKPVMPLAQGYDVARPSNRRRIARVPAKDEDRLLGAIDRQQLRVESRNAYRNNPLARAIHDRVLAAVVGAYGLLPQSEASNKAWASEMEKAFLEWSKVADYRQRSDLVELQRMAVSHLLIDGEAFFILLSNGQIQPVEPERIFTGHKFKDDEQVIDGIRVDDAGRIKGYYVADRNSQGYADATNHSYIAARDMIHVRQQNRFDALRGVPFFAPVLSKIIDFHETEEALLMKVKGEAKRGFAIKSDVAEMGGGNLQSRNNGYALGNSTDGGTEYESILEGSVYYLNEGETIDPLETKSPNSNHAPYVQQLVIDICSGLGLSDEWVLNHFGTSYIASRASMITTETTIEQIQLVLEIQMMQRLWNWQCFKQFQAGRVSQPSLDANGMADFFRVNWIYNRLPNLDEEAIAKADAAQWRNATTSLTRLAKQHGTDFDTLLNERLLEAKKIVDLARANNVPEWYLFPPQAGMPITSAGGNN